jgi:hypothetical protein
MKKQRFSTTLDPVRTCRTQITFSLPRVLCVVCLIPDAIAASDINIMDRRIPRACIFCTGELYPEDAEFRCCSLNCPGCSTFPTQFHSHCLFEEGAKIRLDLPDEIIDNLTLFNPDNDCTCTYQTAGITELRFSDFIIPITRPVVKFVSVYPIMTTDEKKKLAEAMASASVEIQTKFFVIVKDFLKTKEIDKIASGKEHVEEDICLDDLPNDLLYELRAIALPREKAPPLQPGAPPANAAAAPSRKRPRGGGGAPPPRRPRARPAVPVPPPPPAPVQPPPTLAPLPLPPLAAPPPLPSVPVAPPSVPPPLLLLAPPVPPAPIVSPPLPPSPLLAPLLLPVQSAPSPAPISSFAAGTSHISPKRLPLKTLQPTEPPTIVSKPASPTTAPQPQQPTVSLGHMALYLKRANVDMSSILRLQTRKERELAILALYKTLNQV